MLTTMILYNNDTATQLPNYFPTKISAELQSILTELTSNNKFQQYAIALKNGYYLTATLPIYNIHTVNLTVENPTKAIIDALATVIDHLSTQILSETILFTPEDTFAALPANLQNQINTIYLDPSSRSIQAAGMYIDPTSQCYSIEVTTANQIQIQPITLDSDHTNLTRLIELGTATQIAQANITVQNNNLRFKDLFRAQLIPVLATLTNNAPLYQLYNALTQVDDHGYFIHCIHNREMYASGPGYYFRIHQSTRSWCEILDAIKTRLMLNILGTENYSLDQLITNTSIVNNLVILDKEQNQLVDSHRYYHWVSAYTTLRTHIFTILAAANTLPANNNHTALTTTIEKIRAVYLIKARYIWPSSITEPLPNDQGIEMQSLNIN